METPDVTRVPIRGSGIPGPKMCVRPPIRPNARRRANIRHEGTMKSGPVRDRNDAPPCPRRIAHPRVYPRPKVRSEPGSTTPKPPAWNRAPFHTGLADGQGGV